MKLKTILRLWPYLFGLFILAAALWVMLSFTSCNDTKAPYFRCVVDSVWLAPQTSVAEPYPLYHFHTDCDITITSPTKNREIGDTIKFSN